MNSNNRKRLGKSIGWSFAGSAIGRTLVLVGSIFSARLLGITEYGYYNIIQNTLAMFSAFAGYGLGITATRYIAIYREENPVALTQVVKIVQFFGIVIGVIFCITLYLLSPALCSLSLKEPMLLLPMRLSIPMLMLSILCGVQNGILSGFEAFRVIAIRSIWSGIVTFILIICGSAFFDLHGALVGITGGVLTNYIYNAKEIGRILRDRYPKVTLKESLVHWRILYRFSLPALLSSAMVAPISWVCSTFLVRHPSGYEELSIYSVANQWRLIVLFIPQAINSAILPVITNIRARDKNNMHISVISLILNFSVSFCVALPVMLFSGYIISFYGDQYTKGTSVLSWLCLGGVISAVSSSVGQLIISSGAMWLGLLLNMIWAILIVTIAWFLTARGYGALGLAYAYTVSYFLHTSIEFIVVYKMKLWTVTPSDETKQGSIYSN